MVSRTFQLEEFGRALERWGKNFSLQIVKGLDEDFIASLSEDCVLIFLDLGSGQLDMIATRPKKAFKVVVIDHHQIQGTAGDNVIQMNPLLFDIEENQKQRL